VNLLRRTLWWQAGLWAVAGLAFLAVPGWLVEEVFDQPPIGEEAWLRVLGAMAIALAMTTILVANRIEELWWWAWAFAILEFLTAAVFALNALVDLPEDAAAWPWWLLAAANLLVGLLDLVGLARTGLERRAE
jgi:hypothetical protein